MKVKYLIIQCNEFGRPCGWGLSTDKKLAKEEAQRQYNTSAYKDDPRGELLIHLLETERTEDEK